MRTRSKCLQCLDKIVHYKTVIECGCTFKDADMSNPPRYWLTDALLKKCEK